MPLYKNGADAFYCSGSMATIRAMADYGRPVCGHVGQIPSKASWTGGFKAVGKTLDSAKLVWQQVKAAEEAGAFAVEIEGVPHSIAAAIAEKTNLFLIWVGAAPAGHAQYLFSDDVLGQNGGRVPRLAKAYGNFAAEHDRLQNMRIAVMGCFTRDVHDGDYPAPHDLKVIEFAGVAIEKVILAIAVSPAKAIGCSCL